MWVVSANTQFAAVTEKTISWVHVFLGSAETLVKRGAITNHRSIASSLSNIIAKNYKNRLMCVEVIVCNMQCRFLDTIRGATTFSKLGVQFLGLGYCTEQNTDGIPSFVHCSLLRNGNHTLHQKSWGGPSKFFFGGGPDPLTP